MKLARKRRSYRLQFDTHEERLPPGNLGIFESLLYAEEGFSSEDVALISVSDNLIPSEKETPSFENEGILTWEPYTSTSHNATSNAAFNP